MKKDVVLLFGIVAAVVGLAPPHDQSVCAVGDMHGDIDHALKALRLCGAVDDTGRWSGGTSTVVQTGDVLDRGNASLPLLHALWALRDEAAAAGGELLLLMGNHELLNMQGATHYVDADEMSHFGGAAAWRHAMNPQHGVVGQKLSAQPGVALRGHGACRTLFLHAGLRLTIGAEYAHSVEAINEALTAQVRANSGPLLDARTGPLWFRGYARPHAAGLSEDEACAEARAAVATFGAHRMAVGHNIVPFVATRCAGAVHMIDVGMSTAYGGRPAAWRCDVDPSTGLAATKALYLDGHEPPPDLCSACDATLRATQPHPLRGHDEHGDCRNYCRPTPRARRQASSAGGGGSWASKLFAAAMGGGAGAGAGDTVETKQQNGEQAGAPQLSGAGANHVKTEF